MKDCYWCKKSCPDDEVGGYELDPNDNDIELGWICDHCVLKFDGICDCEECKELEKECQKQMSLPARILSYVLG